ncbi:pentapeptide repeat-containing protein [Meridianimaribacter flavus]
MIIKNKWFQQQILSDELNSLKQLMRNGGVNPETNYSLLRDYISLQAKVDSISGGISNKEVINLDLSGNYFKQDNELFEGVTFKNVKFNGCSFDSINFKNTTFVNCNFNSLPKRFYDSTSFIKKLVFSFDLTTFNNCDFRLAFFNNSIGSGNVVSNSNFSKSNNIRRSLFVNSILYNCRLNDVSIESNSLTSEHPLINNIYLISSDSLAIKATTIKKMLSEEKGSVISQLKNKLNGSDIEIGDLINEKIKLSGIPKRIYEIESLEDYLFISNKNRIEGDKSVDLISRLYYVKDIEALLVWQVFEIIKIEKQQLPLNI